MAGENDYLKLRVAASRQARRHVTQHLQTRQVSFFCSHDIKSDNDQRLGIWFLAVYETQFKFRLASIVSGGGEVVVGCPIHQGPDLAFDLRAFALHSLGPTVWPDRRGAVSGSFKSGAEGLPIRSKFTNLDSTGSTILTEWLVADCGLPCPLCHV